MTTHQTQRGVLLGVVTLALACGNALAQAPAAPSFDSGTISGLGARNIGSATMSGRVSALAAHVADGKTTIYVGAASGGVWKSIDSGTSYKPVFDKQPVQSIGAIALDPSNPKNVWVGTGESWTRNSVSVGNGVYRSSDGGESWSYLGFPESERIAKILVHPKNGNIAYVCVPGKLWSDSADRGLYKTTDGGIHWSLILKGPNLSTGCSGMSFDPGNPERLMVGTWDFRRKGWTFRSGGEDEKQVSGSGLYVSDNGGASFTELSSQAFPGLPAKPWGRVEVEIAPSDAKIVYAFIEAGDNSALYRSGDGGKTWEQRDKSQMMVWRPFYFANIVVDPSNADRLFKMNLRLIVSEDGGKSFSDAAGSTHADSHDVWINPNNPKDVILGDDGGIWYSKDGGGRWWKAENLPISQFYHVAVDNQDPYRVYGGLQDNSSWVAESSYPGGVSNSRWENLYGGDGFWVIPDANDPNIVYAEYQGGNIARIDRRTKQARDIQPKADKAGEKLRYNWNAPIHQSPNEPGTIYLGSQFLFRTRDQGQTWDRISPDLSTQDEARQQQEKSGGITVDNSSAEMHTTIYAISESPRNRELIWVGTDDGNVQLTRDGGKNWTNTAKNLKGLPPGAWISWVEASRHDEASAFIAVDRHTFGDMTPHVFATRDYGKSWQRIAGAEQGVRGYANVIRQDPVDADLLYLGTEFGLWISIDRGAHWAEFKGGNFPPVPVRDIAVQEREHDLVIATHGRGIWIIDDISPLRSFDSATLSAEAKFLPSRPTQQRIAGVGGWSDGDAKFVGQNAPSGAVISYYQRTRHLFGELKLEILDADGKVIDSIPASKRRGINRVTWSMRLKPPRVPKAAQLAFAGTQGPRVLPGTYTVRLTKNKQVYESKIEVGLDRRASYTVADRKVQFDASMRVHGLFGRMTELTDRIQFLQMMAGGIGGKLPKDDALAKDLATFVADAETIRKDIVATKEGGAITGEERLREHTDTLYSAVLGYEGLPAATLITRIGVLEAELDAVTAKFDALSAKALPALNGELQKRKMPELSWPPKGPMPPTAEVRSSDGNVGGMSSPKKYYRHPLAGLKMY
ncbi:MAG: sialidase [Rhodanobacteraceae bacterium]|nr:sialidase [Rhodanobacteraceae bacterium]